MVMFADLNLQRLPVSVNPSLRAWDAADELMLDTAFDRGINASSRVLLVNDQFGALSLALSDSNCCVWSDSIVTMQAIAKNCVANSCPEPSFVPLVESPTGDFDLILLKLPKTHSLLLYQLAQLSRLFPQTAIIAGGMVKYMTRAQQQFFGDYYGDVKTSLTRKKARLIFAQQAREASNIPSPHRFYCDVLEQDVCSHANVYGAERLDIGARTLIEAMSKMPPAQKVVDLGCGNGVLGIAYQRRVPGAEILFVDESYMAIASAVNNYQLGFGRVAKSLVANGLPAALDQFDLILCNPPFHQEHVLVDDIAWQLFADARQALLTGGELWVVGNRNLDYHRKLKKHFGNVSLVFSNSKFVVLRCVK